MDTQENYTSGLDVPATVGIVIGVFFLFLILLICSVVACGPHLFSLYNRVFRTPPFTSNRRDSLEVSRESDYQNRRVIVGLGTLYPESPNPEMIPGHVTSPAPRSRDCHTGETSQLALSSPPPLLSESRDLPDVQYWSTQKTECIDKRHLERQQGPVLSETAIGQ